MYNNNHLAHRLRQASVGRDNAIFAYLEDGTTLTYGDLFHQAECYGQALVSLGVKPGNRVAVQVHKSVDVVSLYLGTILAGGVFLPLNTAYTPWEIAYFLGDATPAVFVCDPNGLADLTPIAGRCSVGSLQTMDARGNGTLKTLSQQQSGGMDSVSRGADDLGAILYTSGTTGRSKGAMLSHENLSSNGVALCECWQFTPQDILIHALPIFHVHGLFVALNVTLVAGSAIRYMAKFDADAIVDALPMSTVLMGVPTFYTRLLQHHNLSLETAKTMRVFISGSAPLLAETHAQWQQKTGHAIIERYGMTETGMNTSNPYDGDRRAGTVGFPLPGVDIKITDPQNDGVEMPINTIGLLEVRGKNVFQGYWQMPEKTAEELRDNGFFITGDLATLDERGYISIVGRNKDLIISGGYNVYPKEVEGVIDTIPGVVESAVIGAPHADFGEGVVAVIVPQDSHKYPPNALTAETVLDTIKDQMAKFKQPKKVVFVDSLPRNTMGKVQKKQLRDTYQHIFQPKP